MGKTELSTNTIEELIRLGYEVDSRWLILSLSGPASAANVTSLLLLAEDCQFSR